jgi:soluble lytic murein transglycosylase-like protein
VLKNISDLPIPAARAHPLGISVLAALAAASISVPIAGAASSGGVGQPGEEAGEGGDKYSRMWEEISRRDKRWARKTAECESGRDPNAIGGGGQYRGAFQFLKSTWKAAPKSPGGDPIDYPYRTQAVVAVALKNRDGAGHWPVCG